MAHKERLSMDMQEQIRILHEREYSIRRIAKCLKRSRKTVRKYLDKFEAEKNAKQNVPVHHRQVEEKRGTSSGSESWMSRIDWDEAIRERAKGVSYKT